MLPPPRPNSLRLLFGRYRDLARRFFTAVRDGDLHGPEALLADDVVLRGDGGGKAPSLPHPLRGRGRVAHTLMAWAARGLKAAGGSLREVEVNGQPGALGIDGDGRLIGVVALEIADGRVQAVTSIVNPDKLRHVGPVGDLAALLRAPRP